MNPCPYNDWQWEKTSATASPLNFPTGAGGVLYPPMVFDRRVLDQEGFRRLAPTADDLWLFWMAGLGGAKFRRVGPAHYPLMVAKGSQVKTLSEINNGVADNNNRQASMLLEEFGRPWN